MVQHGDMNHGRGEPFACNNEAVQYILPIIDAIPVVHVPHEVSWLT